MFEIGAEEEEDFGVVDTSANLNDNSLTYNTQQVIVGLCSSNDK